MIRVVVAAMIVFLISCNNEVKDTAQVNQEETATTEISEFKAWGNEPGWMVEIIAGQHIRYIGDYGQDSLMFPYTQPVVASGDSAYTFASAIRGDATEVISIHFQKETCTDDADRQHEYSVKLAVRNKMLQGCGDKVK